MNQCNCKLGEIGDVVVKEFSGLIHAGVETTVANLGNIGMVWRRDEFFQICEPVEEIKFFVIVYFNKVCRLISNTVFLNYSKIKNNRLVCKQMYICTCSSWRTRR